MYEVAKDVAEGAFVHLGLALKNYFESQQGTRKGRKVGFPRYTTKKRAKRAFRLNNDKFWVEGHTVHIPKLGLVNMAEPLRWTGKILGAVVSQVADWWYISIQVALEPPSPVEFPQPAIGVDVGIKTLATLSDGSRYENQVLLRRQLRRLSQLNRSLARRVQGSARWWRAKRTLARFHARIRNQRQDVLHKMTTAIVQRAAIIGVEDLHVQGMQRNHRLALSLADASFGTIIQQLEAKAPWFGSRVVRVGRFFASSKICSSCGHVNQTLTLADRQWVCTICGVLHERDWNASKNLEAEALRLVQA
jgi:putative transposase